MLERVVRFSEEEDSALAKAVKEATTVIEETLEMDGEEHTAISFNGGKDCTVLLHLLAVCLWHRKQRRRRQDAAQPDKDREPPSNELSPAPTSHFRALYVTCSAPFSEVDAFVDACAYSYNLDLVCTTPGGLPMKEALFQYKAKEPDVTSILVGTRRDDPHGESLSFRTPTDEGWPSYQRVHPIINWTYQQIWEYLRMFQVPYCDLYNQGTVPMTHHPVATSYTSLGSTFNTYPNPALREANGHYLPAYELKDGSKERHGRTRTGPITPAL
ncbi:SubName: Full=Related to FAD1-flavin adenine dinucleotide (FAD) synthetase {ECO:0000313/EMBL:CCA69631.1} [Serendipita indica DSM 11827]|nr:SubName: Full=Related to FAD1-flavin adenine dinucleotide (FAD) synthetase {ECO:0000313/EMBL:CCA69631.1} [Serendipita indica DSM 11827]